MLGEMQPGGEIAEPTAIDAAPDEYLGSKRTWQKLFISFAGPAMNLLLPVQQTHRPAPLPGIVVVPPPITERGMSPPPSSSMRGRPHAAAPTQCV